MIKAGVSQIGPIGGLVAGALEAGCLEISMHAELENWNNGWHGLRLGLRPSEIPRLIQLLQNLQQDPEQHFHISSDYAGESGLGDIEISVAGEREPDNMRLSGLAIAPGTEMPAAGA